MALTVFKTTAELQEGLKVNVQAGEHSFILDEPKDLGGTDLGMNPVEALLGSLGACKCIVARSFARLHRIDLKNITVEVEGDLDPDGFMGKNKDAKIGFTEIRTNLIIESDSDEEDIKKFVEFIDRTCPVFDTIVNTPNMVTEITIK